MDLEKIIAAAPAVSLEEMLAARESRAAVQKELLDRHNCTLVSFTLNIPGAYKAHDLARRAFEEGVATVDGRLSRSGMKVRERLLRFDKTGFEAFWAVAADADAVKRLMAAIEDAHALGRLFDIDVLDSSGGTLRGEAIGRKVRQCLVCGEPVWNCARSRAHTAEELSLRAASTIREHIESSHAERLAACAQRALLHEVGVTPKPGLVDRANNGAHRDMDIFTFVDSAAALIPYFYGAARRGMAFTGEPGDMLSILRPFGMWAEERMFAATGGVNTHKGLIFSLGIICAALGYMQAREIDVGGGELLHICAEIASATPAELKRPHSGPPTHGEAAFLRYGYTGARGEAAAGFPAVSRHGLPALRKTLAQGAGINDAGVVALLHLMAHVRDTNIVTRADPETLASLQVELQTLLKTENDVDALVEYAGELDLRLIRQGVSPGGCADLLAITFMLHFVLPGA